MRVIIQPAFTALASPPHPDADRVVLHRRTGPVENRTLVLLIHGLSGRRYETWRTLPAFIYSDLPEVDVALYAYPTALQRVGRFWRSIPLEHEAEILAGVIRRLGEYSCVILIGHSMGGILARGALGYLALSNQRKVLRRVAGLCLLGCPQLGSQRVPVWCLPLSRDLRVLYPHNKYLLSIHQAFVDHFDGRSGKNPSKWRNLHSWALWGTSDHLVDKFSALADIPASQREVVPGTHKSIVKPAHREEAGYRFIKGAICHTARLKESIPGESGFSRVPIIRPVELEDLDAVFEFASSIFDGEEMSSRAAAEQWLAVDPHCVWMVEDPDSGHDRTAVLGYFCVLPLHQDATNAVLSGDLKGAELTASDLSPTAEDPAAVYIGGIAAVTWAARGVVIERLRAVLLSLIRKKSLTVLTRPITRDGLRLAQHRGFSPADRERGGLGALYVREFTRRDAA